MPRSVDIVEVGPRDGLQDEHRLVSTDDKVAFVQASVRAGIRRVEVASFVNPRRVPQMADAEAVVAGLQGTRVDMIGLVLNERGLDRAIATGISEINTVVVVTDTFSHENQGMSTKDAVAMWHAVARRAQVAGVRAGVTLSAAFGCPFEGRVDPAHVRRLAEVVADQADEISLADTIGCAVPTQTEDLVAMVREATGKPVRVHLHNSRSSGLANAVAALLGGATALDASTGGIGGCPFAPTATGNVATEDLVAMLEGMGVSTGVDVGVLLDTVTDVERMIGHAAPGMLSRTGVFPRPA
jgi:hydroxymethylglutaryl-CoA lyase